MMSLKIPPELLSRIHEIGEKAYPEEAAGFLVGTHSDALRTAESILPLQNQRGTESRLNRYLISAEDMMKAEAEAEKLGLELIGIFHSHPDHPGIPSEYDRQWALPWFSYLITSVRHGKSMYSRSWRLRNDRLSFDEELIIETENSYQKE